MDMQHGPAQGFDTMDKQSYRTRHWSIVRQLFRYPAAASIAMMPAAPALEPSVARGLGFTGPIYAIDHELEAVRAIRAKHPDIRTIHGDIVMGARELANDGIRVNVFNADLCSTVIEGFDTLRRLAQVECFAPGAIVSVTVLRGRDGNVPATERDYRRGERLVRNLVTHHPEARRDIRHHARLDPLRVNRIVEAFGGVRRVELLHSGTYKSDTTIPKGQPGYSPSTMMWVTFRRLSIN